MNFGHTSEIMKIKTYHATSQRITLPFKPYTHFGTVKAALTHLASNFPESVKFTLEDIDSLSAEYPGQVNGMQIFEYATLKKVGDIIAGGRASLFEVNLSMKNPLSFARRPYTTMIGAFEIATALGDSGLLEQRELDYIFNRVSSLKPDAAILPRPNPTISLDKIKMALMKKGHDGLEYFDPLISESMPSYLTFFPAQISDVRQIRDASEIQARLKEFAPPAA